MAALFRFHRNPAPTVVHGCHQSLLSQNHAAIAAAIFFLLAGDSFDGADSICPSSVAVSKTMTPPATAPSIFSSAGSNDVNAAHYQLPLPSPKTHRCQTALLLLLLRSSSCPHHFVFSSSNESSSPPAALRRPAAASSTAAPMLLPTADRTHLHLPHKDRRFQQPWLLPLIVAPAAPLFPIKPMAAEIQKPIFSSEIAAQCHHLKPTPTNRRQLQRNPSLRRHQPEPTFFSGKTSCRITDRRPWLPSTSARCRCQFQQNLSSSIPVTGRLLPSSANLAI